MAPKNHENEPFLSRDIIVYKPNFSYVFTSTGILNVLQLIGNIACVATTLFHCQPKYKGKYGAFLGNYQELFFLLTNFSCITSVSLMFLCNTISMKTCNDAGRTVLGIIFNGGLCLMSIISTFIFFQSIETKFKEVYGNIEHDWKVALSIVGLVNAAIFAYGIVDAYKSRVKQPRQTLNSFSIKKING